MTNYHFVGIKGSGMSPLAQVLHDKGYYVQGSDVEKYFFTQTALEDRGIKILPFSKENIKEDFTIIAGNAFKDNHEELEEARSKGLSIIRYHDFLGKLISQYTSIAVTGTHGKTTTTGMISHVMSKYKPTSFLIGDGTGSGKADATYFCFEACEYRNHFHAYSPDYAIMLNIDFDHPDFFTDIEDVFQSFQHMAMQVKKGIFACGDDEQLQKIQAKVPVVFYGFGEENDFQARDLVKTEEGTTFDVYVRNTFYHRFTIHQFGNHNVLNALACIALCHYEEIPAEVIEEGLKTYQGVKRRFSAKQINNQILIDDYAHHPTEIRVTLEAARQKYPTREIVAIFQPHTFSRTQAFLEDFANSLSNADKVYLCEIFGSARENNGQLTIHDLAAKIEGAEVLTEDQMHILQKHENSALIFMGAGDITKFQAAYEKTLE